jgi:hypothetical protein
MILHSYTQKTVKNSSFSTSFTAPQQQTRELRTATPGVKPAALRVPLMKVPPRHVFSVMAV